MFLLAPALTMALMMISSDKPAAVGPKMTTSPAAAHEMILTIASKIAGRSYRVQIFTPSKPPPAGGYPVIFVTDGSGNFRTAADQMWAREYVDLTPAIIVGLSQPTDDIKEFIRLRSWDLTPDKPNAAYMPAFRKMSGFAAVTVDDTGGAELFYRFIVDELRPKLMKTLPINEKNQALFGHSFGGLFTLYVLFNHPTSFRTYAASSPSIAWNDGSVLKMEPAFAAEVAKGAISPRIVLMKGGLEDLPDLVALAGRLKSLKGAAGYKVAFQEFAGESHVSVTPAAVARSLTFAFDKRQPN